MGPLEVLSFQGHSYIYDFWECHGYEHTHFLFLLELFSNFFKSSFQWLWSLESECLCLLLWLGWRSLVPRNQVFYNRVFMRIHSRDKSLSLNFDFMIGLSPYSCRTVYRLLSNTQIREVFKKGLYQYFEHNEIRVIRRSTCI